MSGKSIEEFTDKELETTIKRNDDLIRFYNLVNFNRDQILYKALDDFLTTLKKERERRKS